MLANREGLLRNSTLAEVVGAWKICASSYQPHSVDYLVIRSNLTAIDVFRCGEFESYTDILAKIEFAAQGAEAWAQWRQIKFSDGKLKFVEAGKEAPTTHWFRTALDSGRFSVCDGFIDLKPGDLVWAELFPDPSKRKGSSPPQFPPRFITSPQPLREFLLRRLPEPKPTRFSLWDKLRKLSPGR